MQHAAQPQAFLFPLAQLGAVLAMGMVAALFLGLSSYMYWPGAALAILATFATIKRSATHLATILVSLAFLFSGATLAVLEKQDVPANSVKQLIDNDTIGIGDPVEVTGVLERDPEVARDRVYIILKVERITVKRQDRKASGVVTLLLAKAETSPAPRIDSLDLRYGARIRVMTSLDRANNFRNPGVSSFTEYLDRKGYDATGFVKSALLIERLENDQVFLPLAWLYEWRRKLQTEIDSHFGRETAGVLDAALLGNRYNLPHSTAERFREGGTFHVLVISGLHITFLGGLVFLITRRLTKNRTAQFLLSVAVLCAYSLAVGAEASVVRAALMFTLVLLGPLVSRRATSLNVVGGVGIALLVWRPSDILDPSFQLTFLSVLAIVVLAWPLLQKMSDVGAWSPSRETPYPPSCASWLRNFSEILYWSEQRGKRELERANYSYRLFKAPWAQKLERFRLQRPIRYAFGAIVVSVSVQLVLLPFLILYFHRLSVASIVLNIGVSLLMAAVAFTGLAGVLIAQISSTLAVPLIEIAEALNWFMVHSVDPFAKVGVASMRVPEYTGWAAAVYGLYYVPLALLAIKLSRWQPLQLAALTSKTLHLRSRIAWLALAAQLFAIVLIVLHPWSAGALEGKLRVEFLDVGQGDAALVTFPDNTTLLVDGGGRPGPFGRSTTSVHPGEEMFESESRSIGESVVSEFLWWRGLNRIDYVLATHADADHMDGLNDVVRNFAVRAALVARTPVRDPEYAEFVQTLSDAGRPVRVIGAGDELRFGDVQVNVLWPPASSNPGLPSQNNDSLVLQLRFGDRLMVLTGDVEGGAEKAIVTEGKDLHADVVKVAHHGSRTSSGETFVAATRPGFAVISVGQTSIFGHPSREVVERWQAAGAHVLTTGRSGTITFTTDGRDLKWEAFVKEN